MLSESIQGQFRSIIAVKFVSKKKQRYTDVAAFRKRHSTQEIEVVLEREVLAAGDVARTLAHS